MLFSLFLDLGDQTLRQCVREGGKAKCIAEGGIPYFDCSHPDLIENFKLFFIPETPVGLYPDNCEKCLAENPIAEVVPTKWCSYSEF